MMPTYRPSLRTHALSPNIHTYARQKHKLIEMLFGVTYMSDGDDDDDDKERPLEQSSSSCPWEN